MEPKNRLLIVIAITALIVGAMFTSLGRSLFALNTPEVVLPSTSSAPSVSVEEGSQLYHPVGVSPQTAASVIATLVRPDSYYRELSIELFWPDGQSTFPVQVWADQGWSHIRQIQPSGAIRHDLIGDGQVFYWYEGSQQYLTAPADRSSQDLAQHIPTYELVMELDHDQIAAAYYDLKGELPCIYVETAPGENDWVQRYWISVDSGLLVYAEMLEDGQLTYRMSATAPVRSPCPSDAAFSLPDGTVMHTVGAMDDGAA